jgi:Aconitase A
LTGLLAKKAVEAGLSVQPYIKTSLSPGSGVVTYYLKESGVIPYLSKLGFDIVGYGCMTCIGNSGPLPEPMVEAIEKVRHVYISIISQCATYLNFSGLFEDILSHFQFKIDP